MHGLPPPCPLNDCPTAFSPTLCLLRTIRFITAAGESISREIARAERLCEGTTVLDKLNSDSLFPAVTAAAESLSTAAAEFLARFAALPRKDR